MSVLKSMVEEPIKVDMTPMIDVVFQLLIFFMCSLNFKNMEGMLQSYLPKDLGIFSAPSQRNPEEPVYIKLIYSASKPDGERTAVWVGGESLQGDEKFDKLYRKLRMIAEKSARQIPALIDPDIDTPFQDIIATLNICRKVNNECNEKLEIKFSAKSLAK